MNTLSFKRLSELSPRSVNTVRKLTALALARLSFNSMPTIGRLSISEYAATCIPLPHAQSRITPSGSGYSRSIIALDKATCQGVARGLPSSA